MLKFFLISSIILTSFSEAFTQSGLPGFLPGTWKAENSETYEHWDKLNDNSFKGLMYKMKDGEMVVTEYLDLKISNGKVIYTATVLNQNNGKGVDFKLNQTSGIFSFENPDHDFPKFIRYQLLSENRMTVTVGTNERNFSINFQKVK